MDGRVSSGDGFSVVWQRMVRLSFHGSEVQGPEPTNCSAWRWQLLDKAFLELRGGFFGSPRRPTVVGRRGLGGAGVAGSLLPGDLAP